MIKKKSITQKRLSVLRFLHSVEKADIDVIYSNSSCFYFSNPLKHFSLFLSKMVADGLIVRVAKGVYSKRSNEVLTSCDSVNFGLFSSINLK